jgi:hypothetical protein
VGIFEWRLIFSFLAVYREKVRGEDQSLGLLDLNDDALRVVLRAPDARPVAHHDIDLPLLSSTL